MGYTTLQSYNPAPCAASCTSIKGCMGFNIAFVRIPSTEPTAECPNPPSTTVIKCVSWGTVLTAETATNRGQWRREFQVAVAGSNGYVKANPVINAIPGYDGAFLNTATTDAPKDCNGHSTNITFQPFTDGAPFDAASCAAACDTVMSLQGVPNCRFFTSYILLKTRVPQGQMCVLYNETWSGSTYSNNTGYTSGKDTYTIAYSQT
jgi:hypothetical protein